VQRVVNLKIENTHHNYRIETHWEKLLSDNTTLKSLNVSQESFGKLMDSFYKFQPFNGSLAENKTLDKLTISILR